MYQFYLIESTVKKKLLNNINNIRTILPQIQNEKIE